MAFLIISHSSDQNNFTTSDLTDQITLLRILPILVA